MTDLELLMSYDRSSSKATAMVRAMYREGVSLKTIADRLVRMGRRPQQSLWWAFGTERAEAIPESELRAYAAKHKIKIIAAPEQQQAKGVVNKYCEECGYYVGFGVGYCDYLTITGHRRGCHAGDGCTRRMIIRRKKDEAQ